MQNRNFSLILFFTITAVTATAGWGPGSFCSEGKDYGPTYCCIEGTIRFCSTELSIRREAAQYALINPDELNEFGARTQMSSIVISDIVGTNNMQLKMNIVDHSIGRIQTKVTILEKKPDGAFEGRAPMFYINSENGQPMEIQDTIITLRFVGLTNIGSLALAYADGYAITSDRLTFKSVE